MERFRGDLRGFGGIWEGMWEGLGILGGFEKFRRDLGGVDREFRGVGEFWGGVRGLGGPWAISLPHP